MIDHDGDLEVVTIGEAGPKAAAFEASRAFLAGLMGPVGGGKTIAACKKCLREGAKQGGRRDKNGVLWRKARGVAIGLTYPIIDRNLLPSWHRVVPKELGEWRGDSPRIHRIQPVLAVDEEERPTEILDLTMEFRAIGDQSVEQACRGLEVNFAWLFEMDTLPPMLWGYLIGRVGRFSDIGMSQSVVDPMIFGDFNAPDVDNYCYNLFVDNKIEEAVKEELAKSLNGQPLIEFFQQPGARAPGAENIPNLPPGYYARQIALAPSKTYIDRFIDNKFAPNRHGQPVFPEFDWEKHMAPEPLAYDPARALIVGMDAGLTPAAVFAQRNSLGQLRVLDELVVFPEEGEQLSGVGPTRFAEALKAFIQDRFPSVANSRLIGDDGDASEALQFWCDPSAKDGTDESENEQSWMKRVEVVLRRRVRPARTNALHVRLEAVRMPMIAPPLEGGQPKFLMSPSCRVLRKGFLSGYHYERVAVSDGTGRYDTKPRKNMFSHSQDALQYAAMADNAVVSELLGRTARPRAKRQVDAGSDYFGG